MTSRSRPSMGITAGWSRIAHAEGDAILLRSPAMNDARLAHLRRLAHWLDDGIRIPGTRLRFGLDPLIGLVPGLGDAAGAALAGWIVIEAAWSGASAATLARMAVNVAVDALVGSIPVAGDVFDFGWKANMRNVALLERHLADPARAARADLIHIALVVGAIALLAMMLAAVSVVVIVRLVHLVAARV